MLALTTLASAGDYAAIIVYGDSFSDNGNLFGDLGIPAPPYWNGRYSNGPVAVENLAAALSTPLIDEAWGGATTGVGDVIDKGTTSTLGYDDLPGMATIVQCHAVFVSARPCQRFTGHCLGRNQ